MMTVVSTVDEWRWKDDLLGLGLNCWFAPRRYHPPSPPRARANNPRNNNDDKPTPNRNETYALPQKHLSLDHSIACPSLLPRSKSPNELYICCSSSNGWPRGGARAGRAAAAAR